MPPSAHQYMPPDVKDEDSRRHEPDAEANLVQPPNGKNGCDNANRASDANNAEHDEAWKQSPICFVWQEGFQERHDTLPEAAISSGQYLPRQGPSQKRGSSRLEGGDLT